ncbi:hypothetical protein OYC64_002358 [Pagothenia borchgrevinki]|uniref:Uncharacterized protein n=1 Tax=Pagothenia borchgrevinki TaxID=8213 RepID=A0ABD2H9K6_PAGBO
MLVNVNLSQSCFGAENVLLCQEMPTVFPPGISNLAFSLNGVGKINSTVLRSESLTSVTHLQIEKSGNHRDH